MKINQNIQICGQNVILVPYEVKHVERYFYLIVKQILNTFVTVFFNSNINILNKQCNSLCFD